MVTFGLITIVLSLAKPILGLLPDIAFSVDSTAYQTFLEIVNGIVYLLPSSTVLEIIGLICAIWIFKIVITIPKVIWDLIPFV